MGARLQPAFWGGLFIGVLSALPFVSALNTCCCVWVIAGGVLTSYLLQESSPAPITAGDGALAGLLAGIIGAVLAGVATAVMQGVAGPGSLDQIPPGDLPPEVARVFDQLRDLPPSFWLVGPFVLFLLVFPVFGLLGGLLGVAMFRRSAPPPPRGTVEVLPPE
jgi:CDP-diglyceride synthetase